MTVKLNEAALRHARKLIRDGEVVRDERDAWSEHALPARKETAWREEHGWDAYARWHLGIDTEANEETKARFEFPVGDYGKVHRCAVISAESRAAQYDHTEIAKAAKELLELIDAD
ncbi:hypothetical protein ACOKGD_04895 [Microbacterium phosphatis]|uniref:hypothetical protein n=1 Tax=Microbacterium phosphatis TaxID=3140248 RepID=UPI0031409BEE